MLLYYQHYFLGSVLYCATLERVYECSRVYVFRFVFRGFSLGFVSFSWFILFTFILISNPGFHHNALNRM